MGELITVETTGGSYRGIAVQGVATYLGIRYGEAPEGELRFRPAREVSPHTGVIDALAYGAVSLQVDGRRSHTDRSHDIFSLYSQPTGAAAGGIPTEEDCLFLNVWAPTTIDQALPVMVWIHGGAFRSGSGSAPVTYGHNLARSGRAIVISLNHRLGISGFLALGHLLGEEYAQSGSAGLSDIALALEWIRDNIAAFGGDAGNVTIFGQSGGGAKVHALLRSPRARGLFHRCIVQSAGGDILTPEQGVEQTARVLDALSIDPRDAVDVLHVPASDLIEAQALIDTPGHAPCPVEDGEFLLGADMAFETTHPMLVGSTSHEYSLFIGAEPWYPSLTYDELPEKVEAFLPGEGEGLASRYRATWPGESPPLLLSRILTDRSFGLVTAEIATERAAKAAAPVFRYEFARTTDAIDGTLGAPHCMEVPYIFGTDVPLVGSGSGIAQLVQEVMDCWLTFAETGVPRAPGGAEWPTVADRPDASTMMIDSAWRLVPGLRPDPVQNRLL